MSNRVVHFLPLNPHGQWMDIAAREEAERAALEARHQAERLRWFQEEMKVQYGFFDHLGWIGAAVKKALNDVSHEEVFDVNFSDKNTRAILSNHHLSKGFVGEIAFGKAAADDTNRFAIFWALVHEGTHLANQFHRVPATHATPFNVRAKTVLCPRDSMILNVLMERQVFAMQVLLDDLLDGVVNGVMAPEEILPPAGLQVVLKQYAAALDHRMAWRSEEAFLDYYRDKAIERYEEFGRVAHLKNNNIQYARLGLFDLRLLNQCFGMNTFGDTDAELLQLLNVKFTPEQQDRLDKVNKDLGIDESKLLTLEHQLRKDGTTPEKFLRIGCSKITIRLAEPAAVPEPPAPSHTIIPKDHDAPASQLSGHAATAIPALKAPEPV